MKKGRAVMLDKRKFYINGEWVAPLVTRDLEVLNPATEKPIAVISIPRVSASVLRLKALSCSTVIAGLNSFFTVIGIMKESRFISLCAQIKRN